ncbi:MAG: hypothetical protein ACPG4X_14660 [Pikeienuella sp.]
MADEDTEVLDPDDQVEDNDLNDESPEAENGGEPPEAVTIEAFAAEYGWAPEEEWRGNPDDWVDAETFLRRGPDAQAAMKKTLEKQDRELSDMRKTLDRMARVQQRAEERTHTEARSDLEARRREAAAEGDLDTYDEISRQINELGESAPAADNTTSTETKANPDTDPNFQAWHRENDWYNSDVFLTSKADTEIAPTVAKMYPELIGTREFYDKVAEETKNAYPDKFGLKPQRRRSTRVESGANGGGRNRRGNGKSYQDLPADAKAACDRYVNDEVMTQDRYLEIYFEDEA